MLNLTAGRPAHAIRVLAWARHNPNPSDISPTLGVARYLLAPSYDHTKRPAEARTAYRAFLDFWKHADPTLPMVQDARKRLSQLGT